MESSDIGSGRRGASRGIAILVLASIVILVAGLLLFTMSRRNPCPSDDKNLCQAIALWQDQPEYHATVSSNDKGTVESLRLDVANAGQQVRYSQFSSTAPYQVVIDDTTVLTRDPTDQKWWQQTFSESDIRKFEQTILPLGGYDLATADLSYKMVGRQRCPNDEYTCYKFEVTAKDQDQTTYYVWFDAEEFRFRTILHNTGSISKEYKIKYDQPRWAPPRGSQWVKDVPNGRKLTLGSAELQPRE